MAGDRSAAVSSRGHENYDSCTLKEHIDEKLEMEIRTHKIDGTRQNAIAA